MEHGAVVIWYAPGDPELAGSINRLLHDLGPRCLIAGSYQGMEYPVVATVWGRLLELDSYDEARLREFIGAYRGAQGPEAGPMPPGAAQPNRPAHAVAPPSPPALRRGAVHRTAGEGKRP